mmetsp:Transcript_18096/g.33700  ORF Transcript_18096/g.33700 Transcript_18096/m.33700 type:complete len:536 (-) Transcript_18096:2041-3648(-)
MARTKQVARKSTGGRPPRRQMPLFVQQPQHPINAALERIFDAQPQEIWGKSQAPDKTIEGKKDLGVSIGDNDNTVSAPPPAKRRNLGATDDSESPSKDTSDRTAGVSLIELDAAVLLGIASYLNPDEIQDYFASCQVLHSVPSACSADAVFAARLGSVLGYFSVLQAYADMVAESVEGGWPVVVNFLTSVARRLRRLYGSHQVPVLHRALVGELALGRMCGSGEPLLCFEDLRRRGGDEGNRDGDDDFRAHLYMPCMMLGDLPQRPSFRRCFAENPDYDDEVYGTATPFVFLGDIDSTFYRHSRAELRDWINKIQSEVDEEGSEPPGWLGPNGLDRIRQGLLPVVWIFNWTSTEAEENRIGFVLPEDEDSSASNDGIIVCRWSREDPKGYPEGHFDSKGEVNTMRCCQKPFAGRTRSLVEYFCTEVESHTCGLVEDGPNYIDQMQRFAWLRAHRIPPFDIIGPDNVSYWEDVINRQDKWYDEGGGLQQWREETEGARRIGVARMSWERFALSESCRFARAALRGKVPLAVASDYT